MTIDATSAPPVERPSWRLSPALTVRILHIALWLLVVSGPVIALLIGARVSSLGDRIDSISGGVVVDLPADTAGAEGLAELFVAAFLSAGEDSTAGLEAFMKGVSLDDVEGGSWSATRTASLGAEEVAPGYFAVTVAAEVVAKDLDSEGAPSWVSVGTRFYSVGVSETPNGWTVTGLPALLPAPPVADSPELFVDRLDGLDAAPGLAEMLPRFFSAYLAGDGELSRYTSPTSAIASVLPPPFVDVEVVAAGVATTTDGAIQGAVVIRATDTADRAQVLEYSLVVDQRDGRWEVSDLLPAPPLASTKSN